MEEESWCLGDLVSPFISVTVAGGIPVGFVNVLKYKLSVCWERSEGISFSLCVSQNTFNQVRGRSEEAYYAWRNFTGGSQIWSFIFISQYYHLNTGPVNDNYYMNLC